MTQWWLSQGCKAGSVFKYQLMQSIMQYLGANLKSDRIISVHFQGKPFITVIQVYSPNTNAKEAEVD